MNFKTIIDAWIIANNPTSEQIELSEKRLIICNSCTSRKEYMKGVKLLNICTECGCPILKKIFTNIYNSCPLEKWSEIDLNYFVEQKTKKTIL